MAKLKYQFDKTLLRELASISDRPRVDAALLSAKNPVLFDSLACINDPEFSDLEKFDVRHKIEVILRSRGK